ncbi:hypothetical protein COB11_07655 [Candidatus Aerophobetes bacterium]|uniref:FAD:protein FMN transferase n=1 Tax=Aerophobetes bacterium TaxID=2030807 RepID=A0A2A4YBX3_UNCAE|nr:MAG: hypothetical protein COB11_07655 [Candidatus Aerophobetes bacterium]
MRVFLTFIALFFLLSCSKQNGKVLHEIKGLAFTMPYKVLLEGANHPKVKEIAQEILKEAFDEINITYNHWNSDSYLSLINKNKSNTSFEISTDFCKVLKVAKDVYYLSDGFYDPTLKPLISLWKDSLERGKNVSEKDLEGLSFGFDKIVFTNTMMQKIDPNIELDFDSLIKGHLVDLICEKLHNHGFTNYFVDFSGDIKACGKHPSGRAWSVGVLSAKKQSGSEISRLALDNAAIATSGSTTQRWLTESCEILTHIINPKTLRPISVDEKKIATVTVKARTCILADALATAAFAYEDLESLNSFIDKVRNSYEDVDFIVTMYEKDSL